MLGAHVQIKMIIHDQNQLPKEDFMYRRRILCTSHIAVDHYVPLHINIRYINSYLVLPTTHLRQLAIICSETVSMYQPAQLQSSTLEAVIQCIVEGQLTMQRYLQVSINPAQ
jgi:hypothetical protein